MASAKGAGFGSAVSDSKLGKIVASARDRQVLRQSVPEAQPPVRELIEDRTAAALGAADSSSVAGTAVERLLTEKEAADFLRLSQSWLAKSRMRGDGPPYMKIGRSIRYGEGALVQWMKSHLRLSTSEPYK